MTATANRRAGSVPARNSWRRLGARWLLLGAVIAGVLAMHTLSAADSSGDHRPMAMTSARASTPAASTSMAMGLPAIEFQVPTADPVTVTQLSAVAGGGMPPMSCCVLFLISTVALVLLMRSWGAPEPQPPPTDPRRGSADGGVAARSPRDQVVHESP